MALIFRSLLLILLLAGAGSAQTISGSAQVIDGDTLNVGGQKVRLHGVDAPELDQTCTKDNRDWPCGIFARDLLAELVGQAQLRCAVQDTDRYGRAVAVCMNGARDINAALVRSGGAVAYLRYSDRYAPAERAAKAEGLGIWSGTMELPEDYRHADDPAPQKAPTSCKIKGNVGASGRIYHLPGQADYAATRINPNKGEAWFCTEAEARAAGFRPAQR